MSRVHHANIRITDPARSLQFYGAIGLEHVGTLSMGPGYTLLYLAGDGSAALELVVNDTADPTYDRSPGSGHIGLEVPDLAATLAALDEIGYRPEGAPAAPGNRADLNPIAFVRDPDGVRVELLQASWAVPHDPLPADLHQLVARA
jgi:catechol 2,3-dioxygenase-like lactoylglutathione lyase family enzyme